MKEEYETIIGLEVHIELATNAKIFCKCSTKFGSKSNTQVCPFCTGLPGTLPILNKKVVEYAVAVGAVTDCQINTTSQFDRKHYFYPDNPQNYQITQWYHPICQNGYIQIEKENHQKKIRIHQIHIEEDASKLIHQEEENRTSIDYNRAGIPLLEIVTEPDLTNSSQVIKFLTELKSRLEYIKVSDCKLEEGSMRVDVNLSIKKINQLQLGTRTEMKNLNSFTEIRKAIKAEENRQIEEIEKGNIITQETRRWDEKKGSSYSMRSKENTQDYRYFPEPDLQPLHISERYVKDIRQRQPELAKEKRTRYQEDFQLPMYDIDIIVSNQDLANLFEQTVTLSNNPKQASNWLMGETLRLLKENHMTPKDIKFSPKNLAKLIQLTQENKITSTIGKKVFHEIFYYDIDPIEYVEKNQLSIMIEEGNLEQIITNIMQENQQSIIDYHSGKEKAVGYLVGQVMKEMKGKGNPIIIKTKILNQLSRDET